LIPPKAGPVDFGPGSGKDGDAKGRRRIRDEQDMIPAEGVGETISTATAALKAERYRPRIYGFQLNEIAKLQRWQEAVRDRYALFLATTRLRPHDSILCNF
jgi:casein kinase II subunit beta